MQCRDAVKPAGQVRDAGSCKQEHVNRNSCRGTSSWQHVGHRRHRRSCSGGDACSKRITHLCIHPDTSTSFLFSLLLFFFLVIVTTNRLSANPFTSRRSLFLLYHYMFLNVIHEPPVFDVFMTECLSLPSTPPPRAPPLFFHNGKFSLFLSPSYRA